MDKKKKCFRRIAHVCTAIMSVSSLVISIISLGDSLKQNREDELLRQPRFSLETEMGIENKEQSIWQIANLGGPISNATIYPVMYLEFSYYSENEKEESNIVIELSDYYEGNYCYRNENGTFYIKDDKRKKLKKFIEEYCGFSKINSEKIEEDSYQVIPHYILQYEDYKGKKYRKTYTIVDTPIFGEESPNKVYGETMKSLKDVKETIVPDIVLPLESSVESVVTIRYKNAESQKRIENPQMYSNYLQCVILDLLDSKEKPVQEMLGDLVLTSDGKFWMRDEETGEFVLASEEVKDFGFIRE